MLICPQCEFENPEANKFCQNCGTSLTHKTCRQCQVNISIEEEICSFCGAANHTVLWAIISQIKPVEELVTANAVDKESTNKEIKNLSDFFAEAQKKVRSSLQIDPKPIKTTNRYAIDETNPVPESISIVHKDLNSIFIQGKVIDKHPLQKPHLATLQKQQMDLFAELGQDLNNSYLSVTQYWNLVGVPTHALPYLILEKYTPTIPEIYDAWQQHDRGVVLLPDRSQWRLLSELWSQHELPLLQIIWFLDEMAKLWEPLSQISCAESLLINSNLRIDEDQSFCLQQLYIDQVDNPPSLKDLAKTWQMCFAKSNRDGLENLNQLLERVTLGEIEDVEQLRLELHDLGLGEDDIESFDIHTNYLEVNTPESQSNHSNQNLEDFESQNFFDEHNEEMLYSSDSEDQATAMIPMQLDSIVDASCTDIGSERDHNEDFFGVKTVIVKEEKNAAKNLSVRGTYIVCDGMGGHAAGEVASAMAVENLQKYFQTHWKEELPDQKTIEEGILLANNTLYKTNLENSRSGSGRMGTTLVMALLQDTQLAIASVGDSRIYRVTRKQGLEQLTLDHEVGQREINRGVEPDIAYGRPDAYQLTQALGPRDTNYVRPDVQFIDITEDSLLLLCSDGLSDNNLLEQHWKNYLEPLISSSADLQSGLFKLVEFANHYNGHDNITGILVRIKLKPDC
jgi:protein phosphatase